MGRVSSEKASDGPDMMTFVLQRFAEDWSAARDRELAEGLNESRATRDIDAKRAILAELDRLGTSHEPGAARVRLAHDVALRHFASVYRDHADYQAAWWGP